MNTISSFDFNRIFLFSKVFFSGNRHYYLRLSAAALLIFLLFPDFENNLSIIVFVSGFTFTQLFIREMQQNRNLFFMLPVRASEKITALFILNTLIPLVFTFLAFSIFYLLFRLLTPYISDWFSLLPWVRSEYIAVVFPKAKKLVFIFLFSILSQSFITLFMIKTSSLIKAILYFALYGIVIVIFISLIGLNFENITKELKVAVLVLLSIIFSLSFWFLSYRNLKNKEICRIP